MALVGTSLPFQNVAMPALDLRRYLAILISSEGVAGSGDMAVAQRSAGANMSVDIAAGEAYVQGDSVTNQGFYFALNDATYNLTGFTAAHGSLPRIDRVVLRVRDAFHGDAASDVAFAILTGTATSGATLANTTGAATPGNGELVLANILVPAAATTITTANIDTTGASNNSPLVRPMFVPAGASVPPGSVQPYAGATAPLGWLLCNGDPVSRTTYGGLFAVIGTTYGTGDGSTTFNVPDVQGRGLVGKGTHADVDTLGENDGVAAASRTPKHQHTGSPSGQNVQDVTGSPVATGGPGVITTSLNAAPYLVLNYIIKT
jgi:microcystin-dependent protein